MAILLLSSSWWHISRHGLLVPPALYVFISLLVWATLTVLRLSTVLFRNCSRKEQHTQAVAVALPDSYHIFVKVSRPWKFHAGQFVYLTIPDIGRWGAVQAHPFMISSWLSSDLHSESLAEHSDGKNPDTVCQGSTRFH